MKFNSGKLSNFKENVSQSFAFSNPICELLIPKKDRTFAIYDENPRIEEREIEDHEIVYPFDCWKFDTHKRKCAAGKNESILCFRFDFEGVNGQVEVLDEEK